MFFTDSGKIVMYDFWISFRENTYPLSPFLLPNQLMYPPTRKNGIKNAFETRRFIYFSGLVLVEAYLIQSKLS